MQLQTLYVKHLDSGAALKRISDGEGQTGLGTERRKLYYHYIMLTYSTTAVGACKPPLPVGDQGFKIMVLLLI